MRIANEMWRCKLETRYYDVICKYARINAIVRSARSIVRLYATVLHLYTCYLLVHLSFDMKGTCNASSVARRLKGRKISRPSLVSPDVFKTEQSALSSALTLPRGGNVSPDVLGFLREHRFASSIWFLVAGGLFLRYAAGCFGYGENAINSTPTTRTQTGRKSHTSAVNQDNINPLWPGGISSRDVNELVDDCLKDPDINLKGVPDYLERQIYKATIQLTLNALYRSLSGLHGHQILRHKFQLTRVSRPIRMRRKERMLLRLQTDVEMDLLEEVADRLVENKFVDLPLIPDAIERPIYVNCLKIVFRVVDLIATSFCVTVCGHDLSIQLSPSLKNAAKSSVLQRASSMSSIDMEHMIEIAKAAGVDPSSDHRSILQRFFSPANNNFVAQVHASMFCLILGVLDDLLDNTEIQILSDRIGFDIIPAGDSAISYMKSSDGCQTERSPPIRKRGSRSGLLPFVLGVFATLGYQRMDEIPTAFGRKFSSLSLRTRRFRQGE